ncbi:MAG: D-alanyl-D-alanine carboxypeptidase [Clostridia bacterium]|nr:D-alanyl-D-alanine carboxypeptidase [Clostridia bacterium]
MNNNYNNGKPDNNRQTARPVRPPNGDLQRKRPQRPPIPHGQGRQRLSAPNNQNPAGQGGRPTPRPDGVRRQNHPTHNLEVRHTTPISKRNGGLAKFAVIWIAVLAVILAVILITAGLRNEDDNSAIPAGANTAESTETTTTTAETTATFPVDHSDYTDQTRSFSVELDFANGILIDIEKGEVVASRGGDSRIFPASMTKVMTLIVAAEAVESLDETFTMTAEITDPLYIANASVAGFLVGEQVTVRDLIYGLVLPSGGDGALGLAYHIAGSEAAFAELMNEKAAELGLRNTHFTNCTGLHNDDHYSTCHEIAMIVEYAISDPFMREVLTTYQYTTESTPEHPDGILLTSTLLSRMAGNESGTMFVQGGKTGYTIEAKNCLASFATPLVPGMSEDELKLQPTKYILVTAGSGEKFGPVFDAISIYKSFADGSADAAVTATADAPDEPASGTTPADTGKKDEQSVKIYTAKAPS